MAEQELQAFKKQHTVIKRKLTMFKNFIDSTENKIKSLIQGQMPDRKLLIEIETRLLNENNLLIKFEDIQYQIDLMSDDSEDQLEERESFTNTFYEMTSKASAFLAEYRNILCPETVQKTGESDSRQRRGRSNSPNMKLPKIKLPIFSGGYHAWLEFRSLYMDLVHNKQSIGDSEKFYYLKMHLEGDAKRIISNIEVTAENYKGAWDKICERFNNKRMLVHSHLKALHSIQEMNRASAESLRQLSDEVCDHLRSLTQLGVPTESWDSYLIFNLALKLDGKTKDEWEAYKIEGDLPTFTEFKTFLNERADRLERKESRISGSKPTAPATPNQPSKMKNNPKSFVSTYKIVCNCCKGEHWISQCPDFLGLSHTEKLEKAKSLRLCTNCLRHNHKASECKSTLCKTCNRRHHTLLHRDDAGEVTATAPETNTTANSQKSNSNNTVSNVSVSNCHYVQANNVLLSTALVNIYDASNNVHTCRVLLDSGSQSNIICQALCDKLKVTTNTVKMNIAGINQVIAPVKHRCTVTFGSRYNNFTQSVTCLVLSSICDHLPSSVIDVTPLNIPPNLPLADPQFFNPSEIQLLLGAEYFYSLLRTGNIRLGSGLPTLQNSVLGWIISGPTYPLNHDRVTKCFFSMPELQKQLAKFWELEEPSPANPIMNDNDYSELHFSKTVTRHPDGKFVVNIPFKTDPITTLGESRDTALKSYLAVRCVKQISIDSQASYPKASQAISSDFYVDDFLSGGDSIEEVNNLCLEVSSLLQAASFNLRKWTSNEPASLNGLSSNCISSHVLLSTPDGAKTFGLSWSPQPDILKYQIPDISSNSNNTKRSVLSSISQIFDPLGLIAPCIILVKILIQRLWSLKIDWDQELPDDLNAQWNKFRSELPHLHTLQIPRGIISVQPVNIQLHGFSDSSQEAYGACIYLRCTSAAGDIRVSLLIAKSKVAPLQQLSIPRLELSAALLLSKLYERVKSSVRIPFDSVHLWCDSTVTLSWIKAVPHSLKTFVANRVQQIQEHTEPHFWHYVQTSQNPADLVSRGLHPSQISNASLWWSGPSWLAMPQSHWPISDLISLGDLPECKPSTVTMLGTPVCDVIDFRRFSSLSRLKRATAYCLRFIHNCRTRKNRLSGNLTTSELSSALNTLIRISQAESFSSVVHCLRNNQSLPTKCNLLNLNPFLDHEGILRVGGRLQNSTFPYAKRHPIILPPHHILTRLICQQEHITLMHAGPQLMLSSIRERCKWKTSSHNLACGTLVLIMDDASPPLKWALGRVTFLHPGHDGVARVATVRTATSEFRRAVSKLCPLPINDEQNIHKSTSTHSPQDILKDDLSTWGHVRDERNDPKPALRRPPEAQVDETRGRSPTTKRDEFATPSNQDGLLSAPYKPVCKSVFNYQSLLPK
ncbi:hypothetical protein NQ315_014817 [Exocentrus adspersus]|uniref:DUF5641 domain-containing protein n=1 Tax=Exocentrus adspersus TaxID=1586481 RepID=A0AAV8VMD9_9CUCU|nr:hypothetical protein NQ315_014817 [Exocentrus adspersus]